MDLTGFELAVYRRDQGAALELLAGILRSLVGKPIHDGAVVPATAADRKLMYTRLAAAIATLMADPDTRLTDSQLVQFPLLGGITGNVFAASSFGSVDHALRCMGALPGTGQTRACSGQQASGKLHSVYSLDSSAGLDVEGVLNRPAAARLMLYLKYLDTKPILTLRGHERREQLLAMGDRVEPAPLPNTADYLVLAANAFMLCSYGEHPKKHAVKSAISASVRGWLAARGLQDAPLKSTRGISSRPTMVVASEFMHSTHVQYRYFGQWLRQLRHSFRLELLTEEAQVDDACRRLFDDVHTFVRDPNGGHLTTAVETIRKLHPDIIFYPSVGMKHWGVALASLRLAPIQFTALGHSASTFCPTVDYYVVEQGYVSDPALFSEKLILLPDESTRFERCPTAVFPTPKIRANPDPIRVALPSNILKLNPRFLSVCKEIADKSPRRVEFQAFPNTRNLEGDAVREGLQRWLPNVTVHGMLAYDDYLAKLNACDLVLSPYPFGGLHSVVDSLRLGLPVVAMECPEPHGRTDAMLLRLLGMPSWLIAKSQKEYVDAALRLISSDEQRVTLGHQAIEIGIEHRLFGDATTPLRREVLDAVTWMYDNHESIQASSRKAFDSSDWSPPRREAVDHRIAQPTALPDSLVGPLS